MPTLHFVRHALVVIDRTIPSADWQLADDATVAVQRLVSKHMKLTPARILCSPQPKAVGTAEIIAASLGTNVEIRDGLEEHHRENEGFIDSDAAFQDRMKAFFNRPDDLVFGSETANQALARFSRAVDNIMSEGHGDEVVVTHGTVLSLFLARAGGDPFQTWCSLKIPDYRAVSWAD